MRDRFIALDHDPCSRAGALCCARNRSLLQRRSQPLQQLLPALRVHRQLRTQPHPLLQTRQHRPLLRSAGAQPPVPFVAPPDPAATFVNTPPVIPAATSGGLQIQGMPGETVPWSIIVLLTGLTLIPTMLMCVTPFARLLIVFHFLRQALGLQTTPSNQTLIGLVADAHVFSDAAGRRPNLPGFGCADAVGPDHGDGSAEPRRSADAEVHVALCARKRCRAVYRAGERTASQASTDDLSMRVLLPAYILSELKAGFQIGTVLFLPFLIVDMVVASITTSVGMLQLPPVVISTPLKLLLFLMVDGWHLLISSLMRSFS